MEKVKNIIKSNYKFFFLYCTFGLTAVFVEYVSYLTFVLKVGIQIDISKYTASFVGLAVSYLLNSTFNFGGNYTKTFGGLAKYILLYLILNGLNAGVNRIFYNLTNNLHIAFLVAMFFSTIVNYNAIKRFIFNIK